MSVAIANEQRRLRVPRKKIHEIVEAVLADRGKAGLDVSVAVVDNRAIRKLNRQYLGRDDVTDVIAFGGEDEWGHGLLGDIAVSAEKARQEAERRGGSAQAELLLYVVHGLLHLLGMDDATPAQAERMHQEALSILARHRVRLPE